MKLLKICSISPLIALSALAQDMVKVSGRVGGFGDLPKDGQIDVALVLPSLRAEQVLSFDLSLLFAPNEILKVGPENAPVPGNFYAPLQKENYGFFPLSIEKPTYSYYLERGQYEELSSTWLRAPFKELRDYADGKMAYYQLLPHLKVRASGLSEEADWSRVPAGKAQLQFNRRREGNLTYTWSRSRLGSRQADLLIGFQRTPEDRWMLSNLVGNPAASGKAASLQEMPNESRLLFARIFNNQQNRLTQMRGYFAKVARNQRVSIREIPAAIENPSLRGTRVTWTPPRQPGRMAVVRDKKSAVPFCQPSDGLFSIFSCMNFSSGLGIRSIEGWVPASEGAFRLDTPVESTEIISMVFMATDNPEEMDAQSLLDRATEMHVYRLNP